MAKLEFLAQEPWRGRFGAAKDMITYIADDFDAPLEEFNEHM